MLDVLEVVGSAVLCCCVLVGFVRFFRQRLKTNGASRPVVLPFEVVIGSRTRVPIRTPALGRVHEFDLMIQKLHQTALEIRQPL